MRGTSGSEFSMGHLFVGILTVPLALAVILQAGAVYIFERADGYFRTFLTSFPYCSKPNSHSCTLIGIIVSQACVLNLHANHELSQQVLDITSLAKHL